MIVRSRIAPTPSGYLHLGNIFSFYLTRLLVDRLGGKLLLRIDDLDKERAREVYITDIFESLEFLGISWNDGPRDPFSFFKEHSQHLRLANYHQLLVDLMDTGLVYACTCSRKSSLAQASGSHQCDCRKKHISLQTPFTSWRIHVPSGTVITFEDLLIGKQEILLDQQMGDFVVKRKDELPAYHVASLSDDNLFAINLVVRGEDLLLSTAAQLYLSAQTGKQAFSKTRFLHHALMLNTDGTKLSKSAGSQSIKHLRMTGVSSAEILEILSGSIQQTASNAVLDKIAELTKDGDSTKVKG